MMRKIVYNWENTADAAARAECLAGELGVLPETARVLLGRGIDTAEKGARFLHPGVHNFRDPFLMSGMREAAERIRRAADEGETVVIYGDYDADGLSATAILCRAFRRLGIEPYCFVPERAEGYGLSAAKVEEIAEETFPDLFITVDCGIGSAEEVELLRDAGIDVIVTDHHELPDVLPDCPIVSPKLDDDYPFDGLCGAGVAFKLACALLGEAAYDLLDYAALATVADSVPLVDENRDIVFEGLRLMNGRAVRPLFREMYRASGKSGPLTASAVAFILAPRANAAGRMGDANGALRLFLSDDEEEIAAGAALLNEYNARRQKEGDLLRRSVKDAIRLTDAFDRAIVLASPEWTGGVLGITAAHIAEEYCRPVILFAEKDGILKGSARSIEGVNVHDAIAHCAEYTVAFGGHSQAAGATLKKENLDAFRTAFTRYLDSAYGAETFVPRLSAEWELEGRPSPRFVRELERLEPCGVGNRKPTFAIRAGSLAARRMKPDSPHLSFESPVGDTVYFSADRYLPLLRNGDEKLLLVELELSEWGGRERVRAKALDFEYTGTPTGSADRAFRAELLALGRDRDEVTVLPDAELRAVIADSLREPYGTLFFAAEAKTLASYPELAALPCDLYAPRSAGLLDRIVLAPEGFDASEYRRAIYLDGYLGSAARVRAGAAYAAEGAPVVTGIAADRELFKRIFVYLKGVAARGEAAEDSCDVASRAPFDPKETIFAAEVFRELGFLDFRAGKIVMNDGVKASLDASKIFRRVRELGGEAQ